MSPPPGYKHYEPCNLPLCPLRADLLVIRKAKNDHGPNKQMGGQVDGAALSRGMTVEEGVTDDGTGDDDSETDTSTSDEEDKEQDVEVVSATIGTRSISLVESSQSHLPPLMSPSPSADMDYVDMSGIASPMRYSEHDENDECILSLSHSGTLRKRQHPPSIEQTGEVRKRVRAPTPDLSEFASILERKRHTNHWDINALGTRVLPVKNSVLETDHSIPQRPPSAVIDPRLQAKDFDPPTGPRKLSTSPLICFSWYHEGCRPRNRYGRPRNCIYLHTLDVPHPEVSLPPIVPDHNPECSLSLCPIRLCHREAPLGSRPASVRTMGSYIKAEADDVSGPDATTMFDRYWHVPRESPVTPRHRMNEEQPSYEMARAGQVGERGFTGHGAYDVQRMDSYRPTYGNGAIPTLKEDRSPESYSPAFCEDPHGSSPREVILQARRAANVKKVKAAATMSLPKLIGSKRERFKEQQRRIEQWQADNGIKPDDLEAIRAENRRAKNKRKKERRRLRKLASTSTPTPMSIREDGTMPAALTAFGATSSYHLDTTTIPAEQKSKSTRDLSNLGRGRSVFDPEAGLSQERLHSISTLSEYLTTIGNNSQDGSKNKKAEVQIRKIKSEDPSRPKVLVDYDLPSDCERLPWDTDLVRQLFGEIA
jgi:hypothetical protein